VAVAGGSAPASAIKAPRRPIDDPARLLRNGIFIYRDPSGVLGLARPARRTLMLLDAG
jgi:hypothetical protein